MRDANDTFVCTHVKSKRIRKKWNTATVEIGGRLARYESHINTIYEFKDPSEGKSKSNGPVAFPRREVKSGIYYILVDRYN